MVEFWSNLIEAAKAENARGIAMRGGKKYTSVAVRLEIARRHLGDTIGVETEIFRYGIEKGDPIVVRATIRNPDGRIIAQGTAEELRGVGNVNSTSAVENAETSALGRALAMLGLSGGEFASANEMDGVERKREARTATGRPVQSAKVEREWLPAFDDNGNPIAVLDTPYDPETGEIRDERNPPPAAPELPVEIDGEVSGATLQAWIDGICDALPATADKDMKAKAFWSQFVDDLDKYKSERWLTAYVESRRPILDRWQAHYEELFESATLQIARAYARVRGENLDDFDPIGTKREPVILGDVRVAG